MTIATDGNLALAHTASGEPAHAPPLTNTQIAMLDRAWRTEVRRKNGKRTDNWLPAFAYYDLDDQPSRDEMARLVVDGYMEQSHDETTTLFGITPYGEDFIIDYDASTLTTPEYDAYESGRKRGYTDAVAEIRRVFALNGSGKVNLFSDDLDGIITLLRHVNERFTAAMTERDRLRAFTVRAKTTLTEGARMLRLLADRDDVPSHTHRRAGERMVADYLVAGSDADADTGDGIPF